MTRYDRGQTTLDFAVGTGVFVLAVVFVVVYAPTMFDPFAGGTGTKLIVADRAATTLSGDVLATTTADPGVLSLGCVAEFFQKDLDGVHCSTTADFDDLDGTLSLDGRNANVTVHELGDPVSKPATPQWSGEEALARSTSESLPNNVAVATRTVSINDRQYRLTVQVW